MQHPLFIQATQTPHATALHTSHTRQTFAQLAHATLADMGRLSAWGIKAGDVVALHSTNTPQTVQLIHAVLGMGAVLLPLNTRLTDDEVRYQLRVANTTWLLMEDETRAHTLSDIAPMTFSAFADIAPVPASPADIDPHATAVIMFTSGTSGKPKGAVLSHDNLYHSALASAERLHNTPQDCWLCVLPLYHIGGLSIVYRCALSGMSMALLPRFDANAVHEALCTLPISLISLVPTMLYRLLEMKTQDWQPSLRLILLGGASADPVLMGRCNLLGLPVITTYGLTEASSQVCTTTPQIAQQKPASVGKPVNFTRVRVVDDDGRDCPTGHIGEVVILGKTVMQGYLNDPHATAKALRDGALHTGDMGYLDDDGDLWIIQRRSDLIVSGGENVYPAEVEAVLRMHPSVRDVAVVGIPDPEWGQKVACVLVGDVDIASLQSHARASLAGYKLPRIWRVIPALPLNSTGKIDRPALQTLLQSASED